jgi:hypothetical protein
MVSCTRREHKLQIIEDSVIEETSGPRKDEVNEQLRYYKMRNFMNYTSQLMLLEQWNLVGYDGLG